MKHSLAIALCTAASLAAATEHNRPADLQISCNPNGAVVSTPDRTKYYLGKSCDAARQGGGTGRWWYAASAFVIEIDGEAIRFANDLPCDVPYCRP